jgi:ATP-dependent Clp protease ATP-binding subunit ClpA
MLRSLPTAVCEDSHIPIRRSGRRIQSAWGCRGKVKGRKGTIRRFPHCDPYSVVLFDEIEKAHPKVLDLFLQVFDAGILTDAQGRKCDFRESVIILTSNLGSGEVRKRRMGFGMEEDGGGRDACATVGEAIRRHLRPELVNRLTKIVFFSALGKETAREILGKLIGELNGRLSDRGVSVEIDAEAVEWILREGFSEEYGARNLERVVDRLLGMPLADAILAGRLHDGRRIRVGVGKDGLRIDWGGS